MRDGELDDLINDAARLTAHARECPHCRTALTRAG